MTSRRSQHLNADVLREILEWTMLTSPEMVPDLTTVSKTVSEWIEASLYRTILLLDTYTANRIWNAIYLSETRHVRRRRYIKHIGLSLYGPAEVVENILSICRHLTNFALLFASSSWTQFNIFEGAAQQPNRLPALYPTLFSQLTHLDVRSAVSQDDWAEWADLAALPLTHLAFHIFGKLPPPVNIMTGFLKDCACLRVLVLLLPTEDSAEKCVVEITDNRFCIDVCSDSTADWVNGCRGGDHFWSRASDFTSGKQNGSFKDSLRVVPRRRDWRTGLSFLRA
ncbi:hypothetical protein C8R43DRAFT_495388 [Mycena crocata]|nr:hypothetical protein C8R43DRAFT_495388 [Mycena crocata]